MTKSQRTLVKLMESSTRLVCNTQPNPGDQVVLSPEFQESVEVVPAEPLKELSPTLVEKVECSLP